MNAIVARLDRRAHRNIMLNILLEISSDPILARNLVFKGGTALYLLHNLDRFSTDLDFDLVDMNKTDIVLEKIGTILNKYGEVKDLRQKRYTIFGMLSYGGIDHNVKLEISKRGISGKYNYQNFLGIQLNVLDIGDMCANKFLALTERNRVANRDIYDIHFILKKGFPVNESVILEKKGIKLEEYIKECISFLEKLPKNYNILDGLGEVLDEKQKSFCKNRLIQETIFLLHTFL